MNTRALNELADLICRAQAQGKRTPMGIALSIDSAGRHMYPEQATEMERLQRRVAELESEVAALTAQGQVLRATRQAETVRREVAEGEHYASVHHRYRLGRDLPPLDGVSWRG